MTSNDTGDGDTGANHLQNFPVLTAVSPLAPRPGSAARYNSTRNSPCHPSVLRERYLRPSPVTAKEQSFLDSSVHIHRQHRPGELFVHQRQRYHHGSASSLRPRPIRSGNTSELSSCFAIETAFNPAWLFGGRQPGSGAEDSTFDGVAFTNFSDAAAADLDLEADYGQFLGRIAKSPRLTQGNAGQTTSLTLLAGEQLARLRSELFEAADPTRPAWIELTGDTLEHRGLLSVRHPGSALELDGGRGHHLKSPSSFNFTRVFEGPDRLSRRPGGFDPAGYSQPEPGVGNREI